MACSTPVVAVKEGGLAESVIDGKTGILTGRDKIKFSRAIQLLLENEDLATEYGKNGREYVLEKWSWEKAIENLEKGFEKVLCTFLNNYRQ
jgi:glycosyltransferase involved in cell wall biosynthesis